MIRSVLKVDEKLSVIDGLPATAQKDRSLWLEMNAPDLEEAAAVREMFGIETRPQLGSVVEDGDFLYLGSNLVSVGADGAPRFADVTFVLGERVIATVCRDPDVRPFGAVIARCNRKPSNAENPKALMRVLLQAAHEGAAAAVDRIAEALDKSTNDISQISEGYNEQGQELGVSDLSGTMRDLNEKEELVLRCIEAQLTLARTVRYLSGEVDNRTEEDLQTLVTELAGDVAGIKEHAAFEHEKLRYLQGAVTNILNIKQNQIVKVFTIITAVFLPPTLVGTFYGMNFAVMPELSWQHGFIYSMLLTLGAALLPLLYIKRKGWLR